MNPAARTLPPLTGDARSAGGWATMTFCADAVHGARTTSKTVTTKSE
jgi:hypothetical protein